MRINYRNQNSRDGFTLMEAMISLAIFSVAVIVISLILQGIRHEFNDVSATEFYLYLNVIENHGYKLTENYQQRLVLTRNSKKYNVKLAKNKLVMSTNKGGYIPILDHVKSVKWTKQKGLLNSQVQMTNGDQFNGKSDLK